MRKLLSSTPNCPARARSRLIPQNLVDLIWKDKPQKPREAIFVQPLEFSGTLITEKRLQHAFDIDWRVFPQAENRT